MAEPIRDLRTYLVANIRVDEKTSCWIWQRDTSSSGGYGRVKLPDGTRPTVHRASYEAFIGPVPADLVVDHLCRQPSCINPGHLEPVTAHENVLRGLRGALYEWPTHCKHGHELSDGNYFVRKLRNGRTGRQCKKCHAKHCADAKARQIPD